MGTIRIGSRPSYRRIPSPALRERVAGAQRRPGEGLSAGDTLTLPRLRRGSLPLPQCGRGALWRGGRGADRRGVLPSFGPAFREGEGAGAEGAAFALQRPGLAGGFDAVAPEPGA